MCYLSAEEGCIRRDRAHPMAQDMRKHIPKVAFMDELTKLLNDKV